MNELKVIENELMPVRVTDTGEKVVYGTELHASLKIKTPYRIWSDRRLMECDVLENEDFEAVQICTPSGQTQNEHIIKLDTAKEMAMLERNEVGKAVRRYFIQVEKKYEQIPKEQPTPQPDILTTADRIKMMELIATCPPEALKYVAGMAKPFMAADRKPPVCTKIAPAQVTTAAPFRDIFADIFGHSAHSVQVPVSDTITEPAKEKMSTSGYKEPFNLSKLSNHLKRTGVTRSELARRSGIDHSQIGRYLRGVNRPGRDSRDKMCIALGKPSAWLDM